MLEKEGWWILIRGKHNKVKKKNEEEEEEEETNNQKEPKCLKHPNLQCQED